MLQLQQPPSTVKRATPFLPCACCKFCGTRNNIQWRIQRNKVSCVCCALWRSLIWYILFTSHTNCEAKSCNRWSTIVFGINSMMSAGVTWNLQTLIQIFCNRALRNSDSLQKCTHMVFIGEHKRQTHCQHRRACSHAFKIATKGVTMVFCGNYDIKVKLSQRWMRGKVRNSYGNQLILISGSKIQRSNSFHG